MFKHAKGFGESALHGLQILQVFSNERVILLRGKTFWRLALTPVCRASKTKTNVS